MTIVIKTSDKEVKENEDKLRYLLMDALAEFQSHRGPNPEEYVERRYPNDANYSWLNRKKKVDEVYLRCNLAEKLRNFLRVEVVFEEPSNE